VKVAPVKLSSLKLLTPGGGVKLPPQVISFVPEPEEIAVPALFWNVVAPVAPSTILPAKTKFEKLPLIEPEFVLSARLHGAKIRTARRSAATAEEITARVPFIVPPEA